MLFIKDNPIGIDKPIQKLQQHLYGQLIKVWGVNEKDYKCYGRAYKNQMANGYRPEVYVGAKEYADTFFDDTISASSFFVAKDKADFGTGMTSTTVSLIFCVNLSKLKPEVMHRADEEIRQDVMNRCDMFGFSLSSVTTGISNVFLEFNPASIKFRDMHPFHCFRLDLSLSYKKC